MAIDWSPSSFRPPAPLFGERVPGWPLFIRPGAYALIERPDPTLPLAVAVSDTGVGLYLPGGGREGRETPAETLEREALEECAMRIRVLTPVGSAVQIVHSHPRRRSVEKRGLFWRAECAGFDSTRVPEHELVWLDPEEAIQVLAHQSHGWAVRRWIELLP